MTHKTISDIFVFGKRFVQYIEDMLELLKLFYTRFVSGVPSNKRKPPPPNFFDSRASPQYASFLRRTAELAADAQLLTELPEEVVQRSPYNTHFFLN